MTPNELKRFCAKRDDERPILQELIRHNGYTYATDARILVSVKGEFEGSVPMPGEYIGKWDWLLDGSKCEVAILPTVEPRKFRCECCGHESDDWNHWLPVGARHKDEKVEVTTSAGGKVHFYFAYIGLIQSLPNWIFRVNPSDPTAPARFAFDGGCGALMPMRRE